MVSLDSNKIIIFKGPAQVIGGKGNLRKNGLNGVLQKISGDGSVEELH